MHKVRRIDLFNGEELQKRATKTDQGFFRVPVRATRVGVFPYKRADGSIRRELRHPDEVFKKDSLMSMMGVPVTALHPLDLVTPNNAKNVTVGSVSDRDPKIDGIYVDTNSIIYDARAIQDLERGIQEASMGYECEVIEESGTFLRSDGVLEEYDAIQKNITYNHLAIVPKGRAGSEVKFRLDSLDAILTDEKIKKEISMKKYKFDNGVELEVSDEVYNALTKKDADHNEALKTAKTDSEDAKKKLDADIKSKNDENEALTAKNDSLNDEKKTFEAKIKTIKEDSNDIGKLNEAIKTRSAITNVAKKVLGEDFKMDELENEAIKKEVIKKICPEVKVDGDDAKSDAYLEARYDHIAENLDLHKDSLAEALKKKEEKKLDGDDVLKTYEEKRDAFIQNNKEAHLVPLSAMKK